MPAQQAAPATQHEAANAEAAKPDVVMAAAALMNIDFMELLQRVDVGACCGRTAALVRRLPGPFIFLGKRKSADAGNPATARRLPG